MEYITYNNNGRVKYHRFLWLAIMRAKYYKTFVDIKFNGGTKSLIDFRQTSLNVLPNDR